MVRVGDWEQVRYTGGCELKLVPQGGRQRPWWHRHWHLCECDAQVGTWSCMMDPSWQTTLVRHVGLDPIGP